jgi:hypothetical protein
VFTVVPHLKPYYTIPQWEVLSKAEQQRLLTVAPKDNFNIAKHCGVSQPTVLAVKHELINFITSEPPKLQRSSFMRWLRR